MLSDQGSNVDGELMLAVCTTLNISKRRSSAYHSRGNGFAERNILKLREILRTLLLEKQLPQKSWRQVICGISFALNATRSSTTNYAPFEIVYGRKPVLPEDLLLETVPGDVSQGSLPSNYVHDLKHRMQLIISNVLEQLELTAEHMRIKYNKKLKFIDYLPGQQVWLNNKYFKPGENRKCAPRRDGPWTIIEKLDNGVNFSIRNSNTKAFKVVHHDRLRPARLINERRSKDIIGTHKPSEILHDVSEDDYSSSDDSECENVNNDEKEDEIIPRRYPLRNRVARKLPGAIPWNAVENV